MRVSNKASTMPLPVVDAHRSSDEKINSDENVQIHHSARAHVRYQTTAEGDVVVVEPSFDADDNDGRSPTEKKASNETEGRSSPANDGRPTVKRGHTRNLSEHFVYATSLSDEPSREEPSKLPHSYGYRGPPPTISPAVGQKHRRVFSGDVSNPPEAHRRINSIGTSAAVKRRPYGQERQHQRVDSAGLDILTAAADVSREELASAAGERVKGSRNPWDPPSGNASRRSPVEMVSYDHGPGAPAPPPRGHQRPYPPGPPPPGPPPPGYYGGQFSYSQPSYPPPTYYSHPTHPHPTHSHPTHPHPTHSHPTHPHPTQAYSRSMPPTPSGGYPVQYARGPDPYTKHSTLGPLQQPKSERIGRDSVARSSSPSASYGEGKNRSARTIGHANDAMTPPPPMPPSHWRGGTTQGVQTFVTAIGVGNGNRTVHPSGHHRHTGTNTDSAVAPSSDGHHRKTSSISSWAPMSVFMGPSGGASEHPLKGHHRATSSSISFLGLDVGLDNTDATFLQNLQASTGTAAPAFKSNRADMDRNRSSEPDTIGHSESGDVTSKLAPGGTSKRVRRKCTVGNCDNRVVQGGLCISHGAKRKQCRHDGCTKNVKKAGLCSTHGPSRKRCDCEGCGKVAVQGGRCIAHGAKKKLCSVEACTKQAILSGMCKKHHDQNQKDGNRVDPPPGGSSNQCKVIDRTQSKSDSSKPSKSLHKPRHTRGLSIFQEMSADIVGNLLSAEGGEEPATAARPPDRRHHSSFSSEFGNLY